jgi:RNA polymerase sigma factor (sigma-70 family)
LTSPPTAETRARPAQEAAALVVAARAGDREALETLFRIHLPLVYNLVRQALGGGPDADDVVQDVLLRALRQLPSLRDPASFRPWLAAIAVRQIGTHLSRTATAAARTAPLDTAAWQPDADLEEPALLRVELAGQRRQVRKASRWLSPEDRTLLSLWWLETADELTRADVAAALGASVAHTGVRLQRMREQLDLSRSIVAALEAVPPCPELTVVVADWNGSPSPFWRKRIARHTRGCPVCGRAATGLIPADRLLAGVMVLPLPAALANTAATTITATGTGAAAAGSVLGRVAAVLGAHPGVVAAVAGAALLAGGAAVVTGGAEPSAPPFATAPGPGKAFPSAVPAPVLPAGRLSLEAANVGGQFLAVAGDAGVLAPVEAASSAQVRRGATLEVAAGLADPGCYSFRTDDGRWLRHKDWRLRPSVAEPTVLFRRDATFCPRPGGLPGTLALESVNYPGWFLRHAGTELWVDEDDHSAKFRSDSAFRVRPALG